MRIVSLCPSLTELVFDLGRGDALVGRTKFCVHPAGLVDAVEVMGGTKNPKVERIIELAPDLVLLNEEENRVEDAEALRGAGIATHVSMPRDAYETAAMVRAVGGALDAHDPADRIARAIETRAEVVRSRSRDFPPVHYAYLIWRSPWMTISDDTYVAGLLTLAGGLNVFGGAPERYPTITAAQLLDASPDLVLLSSEPFPFAQKHIDELSEAAGLPRERFLLVDGELLSWHGSRTPAGIDYVEQVLRG